MKKNSGTLLIISSIAFSTCFYLSGCSNKIPSYYDSTKRITYQENDRVFLIGANNNGVEKHSDDVDFLISAKPSERQLKHSEIGGYYNFIHFGINTFTDREWGTGKEDMNIFNPKKLDTDEWCKALKASGSGGVVLTAKHHDGFCLFPSEYTDFDISSTPYQNGQGDIVKSLSESCQKYDMKMGIYLSPWDMHESTYGTNTYNQYFKSQLREVLDPNKYGEIFEVWFDGARGNNVDLDYYFSYDFNRNFTLNINRKETKFLLNSLYYNDGIEGIYTAAKEDSESSNKSITINIDGTSIFSGGSFGEQPLNSTYIFDELNNKITFNAVPENVSSLFANFNECYYGIIRELQPNAVISVIGPDIRWVGNENGDINPNEWSVQGKDALTQAEIEEKSQHSIDDTEKLEKSSFEVETRQSLLKCKSLIWNPSESDVKNRDSWFWHKGDSVKSINELVSLYYRNVGGNGNLLLNVPANKDGLFDQKDIRALNKLGERITSDFSKPISYIAKIGNANSVISNPELSVLKDSKTGTGYHFNDNEYILDLDFEKKKNIKNIVISEDITNSQRIEDYSVYLKKNDGSYVLVSHQYSIGSKKIIALNPKYNNNGVGVRLVINQSRNNPVINYIGIYEK